MRNCETCIYNRPIEENGWFENECTFEDHPGIQPNSVFANGCSDWSAGRIDRSGDEQVYQPTIHSDRIRDLYVIKERTGVPMTILLDRAIEQYVAKFEESGDSS